MPSQDVLRFFKDWRRVDRLNNLFTVLQYDTLATFQYGRIHFGEFSSKILCRWALDITLTKDLNSLICVHSSKLETAWKLYIDIWL